MVKATYYAVLGVKSDCSLVDIKKAYKEKLVNIHPDKQHNVDEKFNNSTIIQSDSVNDIQEAYKYLSDEKLRCKYDEELLEGHKKQGFHNSGDGLDEYSLDEFYFNPVKMQYSMNCPRCHANEGFHFTEDALEEHAEENSNGFQVLSQCSACSLWLKVNFDVVEEYQ